jgi:hypothetical protein
MYAIVVINLGNFTHITDWVLCSEVWNLINVVA